MCSCFSVCLRFQIGSDIFAELWILCCEFKVVLLFLSFAALTTAFFRHFCKKNSFKIYLVNRFEINFQTNYTNGSSPCLLFLTYCQTPAFVSHNAFHRYWFFVFVSDIALILFTDTFSCTYLCPPVATESLCSCVSNDLSCNYCMRLLSNKQIVFL